MSDAVHNRIGLLRAERGVSRRELADALGVHYQTIGYLERGEYNPSLHLALRIAAFFGVPVEVDLLDRAVPADRRRRARGLRLFRRLRVGCSRRDLAAPSSPHPDGRARPG